MTDFNVLVDPEHFGEAWAEDEGPLMGEVCSVFLDKSGEQWIAFEVAELAGMFTISRSSRFMLGIGTEETLNRLLDQTRRHLILAARADMKRDTPDG